MLATFADQAVIAIENVRLFDEVQARTRELSVSLEYQTATADVLNVISRSPSELQPVLDAIVQTAARLCSAEYSFIAKYVDGKCYLVAGNQVEADHIKYLADRPVAVDRGSVTGRVVLERRTIHVPDVLADPEFDQFEWQRVGRQRTVLGVPLLREDVLIGVIILARTQVQPFDERQIELVTTFADQAVIAIENVRLFDEIQDKSRQLAEASQHKSQFLANMSHELRTPLNAILGYTELIMDGIYGDTPDRMRDVLDRVLKNGRHLLGLINDVLDLSKIEAGQLTLALSNYSLKDVVHGVYSAVEPLASEKKIALKLEVSPDLPPGRGDERRLTQVLLNLVGNAIKFTDHGEVVVKASANNGVVQSVGARYRPGYRRGRPGQAVPGIPAGRQLHYQEERGHRPGAGHLQAHHRTARREDLGRVTRGAGLDIRLHASGLGLAAKRDTMGKLILVVEDQEDNRRILRDLLTSADYELVEACNGEEALAAMAKGLPDLILMDIQLPVMDGYEATRRIKADPATAAIPVIAVTSYALSGDEEKARAAGCDDFVPKPFSPRQLLEKIRQYLP